MNLGTTVACLSSSRNIYSINNQTHQTSSATTTPPVVNKRPGIGRLSRKSSSNSSTKSQQNTKKSKKLESIKEGHQQQLQNVLYSANSYQDCPCEHHRLARLREESLHSELKFPKKVHFCRTKNTFFDIFKSTKTYFLLFLKRKKIHFCTKEKV